MASEKPSAIAAAALQEQGFSPVAEGVWQGILMRWDEAAVSARVVLPSRFPWVIPDVVVDRKTLPARSPHIEASGKLCLVGPGTLLDSANPRGIILESLDRARTLLRRGLSGAGREDFVEEFLAYWDHRVGDTVWSLCDPAGPCRRIYAGHLRDWPAGDTSALIVADSATQAAAWATRLGKRIGDGDEAYFLRLETAFDPPDFDDRITLGSFCDMLAPRLPIAELEAARTWLLATPLPARILFSIPVPHGSARALASVSLSEPTLQELETARKGFRPANAPTDRAISTRKHRPLGRTRVQRLDAEFLLPRAGAAADLLRQAVAIVGCGSVGARVAEALAASGVGQLILVDNEQLEPANVHRHVLGVDAIHKAKAVALEGLLNRRFPHLAVEARNSDVRELLAKDAEFVGKVDLLIITIGDETLELFLNSTLHRDVRRVHSWVEPLSLGQHALLTSKAKTGCLECVFERDPALGLYNAAAFAAPGQSFDRTLAGCSGSFVPFTALDAARAATLAAELALTALSNPMAPPTLLSRMGDTAAFAAAGFSVSRRAKRLHEGETVRIEDLGRRDCGTCAKNG